MQIGRKIYYELSTGNIILDTGEREGSVVETTEDQDFLLYTALQPYQRSAVGVLQLNFGDFADNLAKYPYHIDITQNPPVIAWDTANPIGASLTDVQNSKMSQLRDMYQQTINAGFTSIATGTSVSFGWALQDQVHLSMLQQSIDKSIATFPVQYADINGNPVSIIDQATLTQIDKDANTFAFNQHQKIMNLTSQVQSATTVDAVNAIQW